MSKIVITELHLAGSAFFSESESFLNDLNDETILTQLSGGMVCSPPSVSIQKGDYFLSTGSCPTTMPHW